MATQPIVRLTEQDYLSTDRASEHKSEYVDGEMYAMSGGSLRHSRLAVRSIVVLENQLSGRNCRVYNSDARVLCAKKRSYLYPDVSVVCGAEEALESTDDILVNPTIIVEVLSPSTADYDHGKKFAIYREIPSFNDYLLVHSDEVLIEQYTRQPAGNWLLSDHKGIEAVVELRSIGCTVALKDIYGSMFERNAEAGNSK